MIKAAIAAGWKAFILRPWYLLGVTLAFMALFMVGVGDAVITAFAAVLYGGYIAMLIRHFHGETIKFDDLFSIEDRWISYAGLILVKTFLLMLGFVCFIIPGVYLSLRWSFAEILVIDKKMKPLEALRASSKMTKGNIWKLFGMSLVMVLLLFAGLVFFIVGAVAMSVVVMLAYIKVYEDLKPLLQESDNITIPNND